MDYDANGFPDFTPPCTSDPHHHETGRNNTVFDPRRQTQGPRAILATEVLRGGLVQVLLYAVTLGWADYEPQPPQTPPYNDGRTCRYCRRRARSSQMPLPWTSTCWSIGSNLRTRCVYEHAPGQTRQHAVEASAARTSRSRSKSKNNVYKLAISAGQLTGAATF